MNNYYYIEDFIKFISYVRECVPNAEEIFTSGNCAGFAVLLADRFPGGKILHDTGHAVYEYNGLCFDDYPHFELIKP